MLDQVVLMTSTPRTLTITDADPDDVLIVKSISGLIAPKLSLFTGSYAGNGGYYQGRRVEQRNPVFNFKLNPDYAGDISVSAIRRELYRMFYVENLQVILKTDDMPDLYFVGNTEDIQSDMWEKNQTAQVSMLAVDPFLKTVTATSWTGSTNSFNVEYDGDVETGLVLTVAVKVNTKLHLMINGVVMELQHPTGAFVIGDVVTIDTNEGSRSLKLNGVDRMEMLVTDVWPVLKFGSNAVSVYGDTIFSPGANSLITSYAYRARWWGI